MVTKIKIEGMNGTALLMHSERTLELRDPVVRRLKETSAKRLKTDEDFLLMADLEFELGLYYDKVQGPYIPSMNMLKCIQDGAKRHKNGRKIQSSARITPARIPLIYEGPHDLPALMEDHKFRDTRGVGVGMSRISRTRPKFENWGLEFVIDHDEKDIETDVLLLAIREAGAKIGLGDYRPFYGQFRLAAVNGEPSGITD